MDMMEILLLVMFIGGCITAIMCIVGLAVIIYNMLCEYFGKDY